MTGHPLAAGCHAYTTALGRVHISCLVTHQATARGRCMQKPDGRNNSKCCVSRLKGIKAKETASVGQQSITSHNYMPRKAQGTVLRAQRRRNSSKQDSKRESADGSRVAGAAAAGAAISAVRWPAVMSPWQRRKGSEQGRAGSLPPD